MAIRFLTAGESHGKALIGIIEGIPAGLSISATDIEEDLRRRQGGYGRGGRMKIEADRAEILSGVRWGMTIGSPICLLIENKDWANWSEAMSPEKIHEGSKEPITRPRPGHADLAGAIKFAQKDMRNILERSSARETAMRVALGAVAKRFLREFGIKIGSFVTGIGTINISLPLSIPEERLLELFSLSEGSQVRCPDTEATKEITSLIDRASKSGDSLGGQFLVFAIGVPPGLGSHIQWDRRLGGRLSQALSSIQAIKGVEIGSGFRTSEMMGSEAMDIIVYEGNRFKRLTNHAGGIEGGMTNGMPITLRAVMKPIPTQRRPLRSVDIITKDVVEATYERSDICAVPAASVIGEAMVALVLTDAFLEKFGGDSISETKRNYQSYLEYIERF